MKKSDRTTLFKTVILAVISAAIFLIPTNGSFTSDIRAYIAITVFCIGLCALSIFDSPLIPSLCMLFGYRSVCDFTIIMAGWTTDSPWIVICVFVILQVAERTGLLNRIAYFILSKTGGTYAGICMGLYAIGFLLSFLGSSVVVAVLAIAAGIVKALRLERTRAGIGIMLCAFASVVDATPFIFDPARAWFYSLAKTGSDLVNTSISYGVWFRNGAVFIVGYLLLLAGIILICKPPNGRIDGSGFIREQLAQTGATKPEEKRVAIILVLMFTYLFTAGIHKLPMIYGFVVAVIALFLPGLKVGTAEDVRRVNFAYPIFIVACLSIGNVSAKLGVGELIAGLLSGGIENSSLIVYFAFVFILCFTLNFFMTPLSIFAGLMPPLAAITMSMPFVHDVSPLLLTIHVATINVLLPYETANNLVLFSFETMTMKDHVKAFGLRAVLSFGTFLLALVYWHFLGLLG